MSLSGERKILLESGTNEFEIMEFKVAEQSFGINSLKVGQLVEYRPAEIAFSPEREGPILGTSYFNDQATTLVDLRQYLYQKRAPAQTSYRRVIMYTEFNGHLIGFLVDEITDIHRVTWKQVEPPHEALGQAAVTGVTMIDDKKIIMLDFEKIPQVLFGKSSLLLSEGQQEREVPVRRESLVIADDSPIVREMLGEYLSSQGFENLTIFENGQSAFDFLQKKAGQLRAEGKKLSRDVDLVLSDIEMPGMDGLTLCRQLKQLDGSLPVVIISSMAGGPMKAKCASVGANDCIPKSDIGNLVNVIDGLVGGVGGAQAEDSKL